MSEDEDKDSASPKRIVKTAVDLQRMKLEKLMKNPEKPAYIPEASRDKKFPDAPEFVRNVMGSSAGAGSGEFHVYRHIRRREYARNMHLQISKEKHILDEEHHKKLEEFRKQAEEKTAKKRAKRQKLKMKKKMKRANSKIKPENKIGESESSDSDENSDNECQ